MIIKWQPTPTVGPFFGWNQKSHDPVILICYGMRAMALGLQTSRAELRNVQVWLDHLMVGWSSARARNEPQNIGELDSIDYWTAQARLDVVQFLQLTTREQHAGDVKGLGFHFIKGIGFSTCLSTRWGTKGKEWKLCLCLTLEKSFLSHIGNLKVQEALHSL